jgi:hypothetical protein
MRVFGSMQGDVVPVANLKHQLTAGVSSEQFLQAKGTKGQYKVHQPFFISGCSLMCREAECNKYATSTELFSIYWKISTYLLLCFKESHAKCFPNLQTDL